MILQQTLKVQVIMHYCFKALNLCIVNPVVPVSVHSDSANGNILLLTNIVYVIDKKILSFQLICPLLSFSD